MRWGDLTLSALPLMRKGQLPAGIGCGGDSAAATTAAESESESESTESVVFPESESRLESINIYRLQLWAGACYRFLQLVINIKLLGTISTKMILFTGYNPTLRTFGIGILITTWLDNFALFDARRHARQPRCLAADSRGRNPTADGRREPGTRSPQVPLVFKTRVYLWRTHALFRLKIYLIMLKLCFFSLFRAVVNSRGGGADWFLIHLFWIDSIIDSFDIFQLNHCSIPSNNLVNRFLSIHKE